VEEPQKDPRRGRAAEVAVDQEARICDRYARRPDVGRAASGSPAAYARRSTGAVRGKSRRLRTEEHRGRSVGGCSTLLLAVVVKQLPVDSGLITYFCRD
jgi:hypothetical protein